MKNESIAIKKYTEIGHNVRGLVVNLKYFQLGASPDRKVYVPQSDPLFGLIKVKCLGKKESQNIHPKEHCSEQNFYVHCVGEDYKLKKNHKHYKQVQGQMTIAGVSWCDFLVYSNTGLIIIRVNYDSDFELNDLKILSEFYIKYYMTVLLSPT